MPENPYNPNSFPEPFKGLPISNSPHFNESDLSPFLKTFLSAKVKKTRQYFLHQKINLDSQEFEECRFDGCTLHTETGDIYLKNCVFGEGNVVIFGERVKKIVQLASILDATRINPSLLAEIKQVGAFTSISIT